MNNKKKFILEDLKRYRQLIGVHFLCSRRMKEEDLNGDLLLDGSFLTEQDPAGDDPFMDVADPEGGEETEPEEPAGQPMHLLVMNLLEMKNLRETDPVGDEPVEDEDVEIEDEFAADTEVLVLELDDEDTVEVDVTDIVDKTEETKKSSVEV
jgi:hypothetical protein